MSARLFTALPIVALVVLAGCDFHMVRDRTPPPAQELQGKPPLYDDRELTQIWNDITSVVGTQARRSSACQTMPIGSKPCGGPWSHLVYSSSSTREARLRSLVGAFNERQAYLNRRNGMASTCDYVLPPRVGLEGGYCVITGSPYEPHHE